MERINSNSKKSRISGDCVNIRNILCNEHGDILSINGSRCPNCYFHFCQDCTTNRNGYCYQCNKISTPMPYLESVSKELTLLKLKCTNFEVGCQEIIEYENLETHELNCPYNNAECDGCNKVVFSKDIYSHKEKCEMLMLECVQCNFKERRNYFNHSCEKQEIKKLWEKLNYVDKKDIIKYCLNNLKTQISKELFEIDFEQIVSSTKIIEEGKPELLNDMFIYSASFDQTIKLWNIKNKEKVMQFKEHKGDVLCLLELKPKLIASGSADSLIRFWDQETGICVRSFNASSDKKGIFCMIKINENVIASGGGDRHVKIWNSNSGICVKTLYGHTKTVRCLVWLNGNLIASGSEDTIIFIWNIDFDKFLMKLEGHTSEICTLARFCTDLCGTLLVSGAQDKTIRIWKYRDTIECLKKYDFRFKITSMINLKNNIFAVGGNDNTINIFHLESGKILKSLKIRNSIVHSLIKHTDDGKYIIIGTSDGFISLWDTEKGVEIFSEKCHNKAVSCLIKPVNSITKNNLF